MARRSNFPPICVALGCADPEQLERLARAACEAGEEFIEIRMDLLVDPQQGVEIIRRVKERYPDVLVLTACRRKRGGGNFAGSIEEELRLVEAAVEAGAELVDVEIETAAVAPEPLAELRKRAKLILSYHNFRSTPALGPVLRRMKKTPADVYKLVTMARKPTDNARVLELARQAREEAIVSFAMGEAGVPSRVLSLARRSAFTYSAPPARLRGMPKHAGTAPGQVTSCALRRMYHAERHTCATAVYGVIANPVGHSISPAVHNRAFQARRIDAVYVPFLVEESQVGDFFRLAQELPVAGLSVTIPHKQKVMRHLDGVDAPAQRIGAVNTVYRRKGKLRGTNTDVIGVTAPLAKRLKLPKARVLVAGTGGGARAAAFALADKGARVFITGRNASRARALARLCGAEAIDRQKAAGERFDVLVHATPLGMHPHPEEAFFPDEIPAEVVFDMVYNPLETKLLKMARAEGKKTICGLEMFLEQAAAQFELWTGTAAPRLAMETVAREALECG